MGREKGGPHIALIIRSHLIVLYTLLGRLTCGMYNREYNIIRCYNKLLYNNFNGLNRSICCLTIDDCARWRRCVGRGRWWTLMREMSLDRHISTTRSCWSRWLWRSANVPQCPSTCLANRRPSSSGLLDVDEWKSRPGRLVESLRQSLSEV